MSHDDHVALLKWTHPNQTVVLIALAGVLRVLLPRLSLLRRTDAEPGDAERLAAGGHTSRQPPANVYGCSRDTNENCSYPGMPQGIHACHSEVDAYARKSHLSSSWRHQHLSPVWLRSTGSPLCFRATAQMVRPRTKITCGH
jgi:hypothetical protein